MPMPMTMFQSYYHFNHCAADNIAGQSWTWVHFLKPNPTQPRFFGPNPTQLTETITIGVRAIFGGGWIDFARKIWGSARKMNSRTNMINRTRQESLTTSIVENRRRTYIYVYIVLLSSIFV